MITSWSAPISAGIACSWISRSAVHPTLQIQRWILWSSRRNELDSELEAGEFIVVCDDPFKRCAVVLRDLNIPQQGLPGCIWILIENGQEIDESRDGSSRRSERKIRQT